MSGPPNSADPSQVPDVNKGPWVLGVLLTIRALAIIIVGLRLYTRMLARNTAGWDDAMISISAVLTFVGGIGDIELVSHGWGRHDEYIQPPSNLVVIQKWTIACQLLNFINLFFMRLSICLFALRLAPMTLKWPQRFTYGAMVLNFIGTVVNCVVFTTVCRPLSAMWNHTPTAHCLSQSQLADSFTGASAFFIVVDFVVVLVPILTIRHLQINRKTKIGISIIMGLGILTASCSIGKLIVVREVHSPDSQAQVPIVVFSIFEEEWGIICASMPAMRQLYTFIRTPKQSPSQQQAHGAYYYSDRSNKSEQKSDPMRSPLVESQNSQLRSMDKTKISSPLSTAPKRDKNSTVEEAIEMDRLDDVERR